MVRVTYTFKDTILQDEFGIIYLKNGYLKTDCRVASFKLDNVIKVEKQVKDLTLEEANQLYDGSISSYIASMYGSGDLEKHNKKVGERYIDITDLVKGALENERL